MNVRLHSEYQFFLYKTITEQREKAKTFYEIIEWLKKKSIYLSVKKVQKCSRTFNLEEEISKGRGAEPRASYSLVRIQYGSGR